MTSQDGYTVHQAARMLGWSESTVRRKRGRLRGRQGEQGLLIFPSEAVLAERAQILTALNAVERSSEPPQRNDMTRADDEELEMLRIETARLQAVVENLMVAHSALLDTIRQFIGPASPRS
ncbi:helix-turn-helix domain-containing protein [Amycolatopsis sp. cmx-8-4]|uniref:helix-turn-helix domain-containing protein n=1 Tax=Amycolatopsis sp. cmx-8-4 TaxID=2790947 RepID=UPI00397B7249